MEQLALFDQQEFIENGGCQHKWRVLWDGKQFGDRCDYCGLWQGIVDLSRLRELRNRLQQSARELGINYQQYKLFSDKWKAGVEAFYLARDKVEWCDRKLQLLSLGESVGEEGSEVELSLNKESPFLWKEPSTQTGSIKRMIAHPGNGIETKIEPTIGKGHLTFTSMNPGSGIETATPSATDNQAEAKTLPLALPTPLRKGRGWISNRLSKGKYEQHWFNWEDRGKHRSRYIPTSKLTQVRESISEGNYWWETMKLLGRS